MAAHVEHEFKGWFVLEEEHLRKIDDLLRKKCPEGGKYKISVKRSDSVAYDTADINELCLEDNSPSSEITSVSYAIEGESLDVRLAFAANKVAKVEIVGDDRSLVFLVYSDLKAYIEKEVMAFNFLSRRSPSRFVSILMMLAMMSVAIGTFILDRPNIDEVQRVLAIEDIQQKLNFLIAGKASSSHAYSPWLMGAFLVFFAAVVFELPRRIVLFLFPCDDFFIGKKKDRLGKKAGLRSNLIWIGVVGTAISIAVGWAFSSRAL